MSDITVRIDAYVAGQTSWPALRDWLIAHTYEDPKRYEGTPDPTAEADWDYIHRDGSFDEVVDAVPTKLSDDQFIEIVTGINDLRRG